MVLFYWSTILFFEELPFLLKIHMPLLLNIHNFNPKIVKLMQLESLDWLIKLWIYYWLISGSLSFFTHLRKNWDVPDCLKNHNFWQRILWTAPRVTWSGGFSLCSLFSVCTRSDLTFCIFPKLPEWVYKNWWISDIN